MNRVHQRGPQGVRGDRSSGSKFSNLTPFQPFYSATAKVYAKFFKHFGNVDMPLIQIEPTHKDFVFPISVGDIRSTLMRIPRQFLLGIKAILVPSGSKKQIAAMKNRFMHGEYWQSCIFLHPIQGANEEFMKQFPIQLLCKPIHKQVPPWSGETLE